MRRFLKLSCLLTALLGLIACVDPLHSQQPSAKWTTGFWLWEGASPAASWSGEPLDLLFVQVGSIKKNLASAYSREGWQVYGNLPDELPAAKEYWLVFRFDQQGVPDLQVVSLIARELQILQAEALRRHIKVAGVQLDIDSPTASLSQYASFLHEVRKAIPQDFQISITALLDWFRNGTAISEVIKEVDEFVPQFYDVAEPERYRSDSVIAAKIDAAKWAPVFNRFRKRFRVGISSFGRVQMVSASGSRTHLYGDVTPLDIANNSTMVLNASRNRAMELVLNYRASRKTRIGNNDFDAGDTVRFTLSIAV